MKEQRGILCIAICAFLLVSCSDSDKEFAMKTSDLVNKNWYYNGYVIENRDAYNAQDVVEGLRFDANGNLFGIGIEYSGQKDTLYSKWSNDGNIINIEKEHYPWTVTILNSTHFRVNNSWGFRDYEYNPLYLQGLGYDAFWVNEYDKDDRLESYMGFRVQSDYGTIKDCRALISDSESGRFPLNEIKVNKGTAYWIYTSTKNRQLYDGQEYRVRFYFQIDRNKFKIDEYLSSENLPIRSWADFNLAAGYMISGNQHQLKVSWNPIDTLANIIYQLEIFDKNMKITEPYYIGNIITNIDGEISLSSASLGEVNRINELREGETYTLRVSEILLEPGVTSSDRYAIHNKQAVTYILKSFIWGR